MNVFLLLSVIAPVVVIPLLEVNLVAGVYALALQFFFLFLGILENKR